MTNIITFPPGGNGRKEKETKWKKCGYVVGIALGVIFLPLIWVGLLASLLLGKRGKDAKEEGEESQD